MSGHVDRSESGQSTLEFTLTLVLALAFVFFYFQLAGAFAFGNYAHYVTFMSARAYQAAGSTELDQITRAKQVAAGFLMGSSGGELYKMWARGDATASSSDVPGLSIGKMTEAYTPDRNGSWADGVRYRFKSRLFLFPRNRSRPSSGLGRKFINPRSLQSESWLGREPSFKSAMERCLWARGYMTTAASLSHPESGQSVLEFLLLIPLIVALTVLLVKMNAVIQVSIVNQQYARAQAAAFV